MSTDVLRLPSVLLLLLGGACGSTYQELGSNDADNKAANVPAPTAETADGGSSRAVDGGSPDTDGGLVGSTDNGGVGDPDPFSPNHCVGDPLTFAEAAKLFATAETTAPLGAFKTVQRTRTCNPVTGCQPWSKPTGGGIVHWFGKTAVTLTSATTMEMRLASEVPGTVGVPPLTCTSVVGGPIACSFLPYVNRPEVAFKPDALHRTCFVLRHDEQADAGDGSSTNETQTAIIGRHRVAAELVAPALAAAPQDMTAACFTCGPGGCNAFESYHARFAIEGAAVRVTELPASPGYSDSALVPFDAQGIGNITLPGSRGALGVAVSGPTLAITRTGNLGDCRAVAVLP
jgi:hypothetical protein